MKCIRTRIITIVSLLFVISLCIGGCSKEQSDKGGNSSISTNNESVTIESVKPVTNNTSETPENGFVEDRSEDTGTEKETKESSEATNAPEDTKGEPADVAEETGDTDEAPSDEEAEEVWRGEDESPFVEEYVVEVEEDEVVEIGG